MLAVCCLTCIDYINENPAGTEEDKGAGKCRGGATVARQLRNDISHEAFANDEDHHDFSINQM